MLSGIKKTKADKPTRLTQFICRGLEVFNQGVMVIKIMVLIKLILLLRYQARYSARSSRCMVSFHVPV